jgi:hypothetical protein
MSGSRSAQGSRTEWLMMRASGQPPPRHVCSWGFVGHGWIWAEFRASGAWWVSPWLAHDRSSGQSCFADSKFMTSIGRPGGCCLLVSCECAYVGQLLPELGQPCCTNLNWMDVHNCWKKIELFISSKIRILFISPLMWKNLARVFKKT